RPALDAWSGLPSGTVFQHGVLAAELEADGYPRETFWPARWSLNQGAIRLVPLRWSSSGDLTSLATANALIRVAAGTKLLKSGSQVEFVPTEKTA
ncbi:MAG: hypothetical protein ACYC23_20620, partial [Limisphaerales bacterium]